MRTFARLLKMTFPLKWWVLLAALLGVCTIAAGVGLMSTSAYLISAAALHPSIAALNVAIVGVRFFGIARGVFRYLERYVSHEVTFRLLSGFRTWFYRSIEPLAPASLTRERSGDLLSRVISDIETLQNFYGRVLAPPLVAAVTAAGMWLLLGAFDPLFALTLLFFFLLAGVGIPCLTYLLSRSIGQEMAQTRAELNAQMVDSLQGMAEIVAFGCEAEFSGKLQESNRKLVKLQSRWSMVNALQNSLANLLINLAAWTMLIVAIPQVREGKLDGVYLALLALAAIASFEAIMPLPAAAQFLGTSLEAGRRLHEIADMPLPISQPETSASLTGFDISFKQVRFRYEAGISAALAGVSFELKQGQCLAIVGPSGSGKSTIANLLLRFWDYESGSIRVGGQEIKQFSQEELLKHIAVVSQQTHFFNTTIRENLQMARSDASAEELEQATRAAQIHEFILSLPQGYNTLVGEQGLNLSGGERQRLAIARAFLKDAPLLILDEATANLDALTEREVLKALQLLQQGRTTIMITHRLKGLETADEIAVLREGNLEEYGTHPQLLQLEGLYWRMWESQNQALYSA
ncbi:thiol reductant ABC exporter subunit CydC [Candidatus Chlorohelix sp.]|uniref:thiol reductant ABC exporter subunit CydC n=1 Tax=Candidatus Chlorohelix sp. TaxID=3139201 RepID=UPI003026C6A5